MKLLYSGDTFCDQPIFKRLLVVAEELHFMDRPSVTFKNWGTVGQHSLVRRIDFSGSPVPISAIAPPSGPSEGLYSPYIETDINNPEFVAAVFEGFQNSDTFASKFIQFEGDYGSGKGKEIVQALQADNNLLGGELDLEIDNTNMFDVSTPERRRGTFKVILIQASISVTSAILVAEEADLIPVTEDPYIARLVGLRASSPSYVGGTSRLAPYIGLEVAKAVLPDQLLAQLPVAEILKYREKAKDAYVAWSAEVNRAAASIGRFDGTTAHDEIARVIATDLTPKIVEYKIEMSAIRDNLFTDLLKKIGVWEVPSMYLAYLANLGLAGAIALFASALAPAIPDVVDYFKDKRNLERRNAMAFLISLSKEP
ncbi:MAG: hypothetical protein IH856_18600 [Deltaproteobacteria bacterium]|nr:hypothetical protein [Deltaproteobacteria bacterium]